MATTGGQYGGRGPSGAGGSGMVERGSFTRFVVVSTLVLGVMFGTVYAIWYAIRVTGKPEYTGPEKIVIPEHAPFR